MTSTSILSIFMFSNRPSLIDCHALMLLEHPPNFLTYCDLDQPLFT